MFLPETIDLERSDKYILSIRIKPAGFMFSITDPDNGKNYCLRETTFSVDESLSNNIQRIIFELNFLTLQFKQVNVVMVSTQYELVPKVYYENKRKLDLYNLSHAPKADQVLSSLNAKHDNVTLFAIEKEIYEFMSRSLIAPNFVHHTDLLIRVFENKTKTDVSSMFVNFHDQYVDLLCFSRSRLTHCITYADESMLNQVYYILKLWEQCEFEQFTDRLYLVGNTENDIVTHLQKYINNIDTVEKPSEIHFWSAEALNAPLDLLKLSL